MNELVTIVLQPHHVLFYLFAYGLAAVPTSYWVARIIHRHEIPRTHVHSHTASFIWQRLSTSSALLVLCLDVLKGLIPCAIASSLNAPYEVIALTGFFAVLGHCFSLLLRFSGGHGGATLAGALLVIAYPAAIIMLLTNYLMIALKLQPGVASMAAALMGSVLVFFLVHSNMVWLFVMATVLLIFVRNQLSTES